jgi:GTPase involved in cell partitioning and DNA repair
MITNLPTQNYCSPTKENNNDGICFSLKSLVAIAKEFNKWNGKLCNKNFCINISKIKHINNFSKDQLFRTLKDKLQKLCSNEYCWADLDFINNIKDNKIKNDIKFFTFKPQGTKNEKTWLNTNNINQVVRQYEKKNNQ